MAWRYVTDLAETDVAQELATSLAPRVPFCQCHGVKGGVGKADLPIPQASKKAKMVPKAKR
jgi:hypothetical protein